MKAIIPCAGFGTRFSGVPKPLLNINNGIIILDKILEKTNLDTYLITNGLSGHLFEKIYGNVDNVHLICNDLLTPSSNGGCLIDLQNLIERENINDDLLILVGDIIFDFSLDAVIKQFEETKTITIPIKKYPKQLMNKQSLESGAVKIDNNGLICGFIEHNINKDYKYAELGIYIISKNYLYLINDCIQNYKCDAPGYLVEYAYTKIDTYGVPIDSNWSHIVNIEDYKKYLECGVTL